jgi:hypothetical protein
MRFDGAHACVAQVSVNNRPETGDPRRRPFSTSAGWSFYYEIAREPRAKNPLPCKAGAGPAQLGHQADAAGLVQRALGVNACLSMARRSYGSCLEDPRLGSGADRRVCPTADL